ncbi:MAG: PQQ-binding-like beta-propeller repeat protein [Trebonia sp.]
MSGAAAVVVVIVGVAFALASGGHTTSGAASGAPAPVGNGAVKPVANWQALSAENNALATWTYGKSLIVAANTQVTAYNQATGAVLWQTRAPVDQKYHTMFCGASTTASGATAVLGLGVVTDSTGADSDCHSIVSLNLATGKLGWAQALPSNAEQLTYARSLAGHPGRAQHGLVVEVSGHTAVAAWLGVMAGFSLTTGAREWTNVLGGESEFEGQVVKDIAISGASTYAVDSVAYPPSMQLLQIDGATGKETSKVTISTGMTGLTSPLEATILSTAPLAVSVQQILPSDNTSVVFFTKSLTAGWVLHSKPQRSGDPEYYTATPLNNVDAHQFLPFALGNGMFVALTVPPSDSRKSTLVAFDAATGTKKWTATVPGAEFIYPVAVTGSVVQAVGISQAGSGNPLLVSIDAATGRVLSTGQPRVLGPAPLGQANAFYRYVPAGGHVYGVNLTQTTAAKGYVPAVFSLG